MEGSDKMTFDWIKAAPWILCGLLLAGLMGMTHLYQSERDDFTAFKAQVVQLGKLAEAEKVRIEKDHLDNLEKVKAQYEKDIPAVRSAAVVAYKLRYPAASCSALPDVAGGIKLDAGASKERLDDQFVADCGDDANKLEAWRAWATLNGVTTAQ
jgi:hypothetical protein